jgi:hypothetical protein
LNQSGINHYPAIQLGLIMLCHSLALVAMSASFIIWAIYEVKQVKLKVNGGGAENIFPGKQAIIWVDWSVLVRCRVSWLCSRCYQGWRGC